MNYSISAAAPDQFINMINKVLAEWQAALFCRYFQFCRILYLYHVAIPTDVSLLFLSRRQSRAAGLQRMTILYPTFEKKSARYAPTATPYYTLRIEKIWQVSYAYHIINICYIRQHAGPLHLQLLKKAREF